MDTLTIAVGPLELDFRDGKIINVTPHMYEAVTRMRAALIATAQAGATTTYKALMEATGNPYAISGVGPALDALSIDCRNRDEDSLAALVVRKDVGEVGDAFVGDAAEERERVWQRWAPK